MTTSGLFPKHNRLSRLGIFYKLEVKMSVVTIEVNLGSGAPEIGKIVAGKLHFDYVDREIMIKWQNYCKGQNMISR